MEAGFEAVRDNACRFPYSQEYDYFVDQKVLGMLISLSESVLIWTLKYPILRHGPEDT